MVINTTDTNYSIGGMIINTQDTNYSIGVIVTNNWDTNYFIRGMVFNTQDTVFSVNYHPSGGVISALNVEHKGLSSAITILILFYKYILKY